MENTFLRGAATTISIKQFEVTAFFSKVKYDANITDIDTTTGEIQEISSAQQSGLHRKQRELDDKRALGVTHYGTHVAYKNRRLNIGLTAVNIELDADFQPKLYPYSQFRFTGKSNFIVGLDYNFIFQNFNFFGEVSRSKNGGIAYLNGVIASLDPRLSISLLQRNYRKDYQIISSNAFRESTIPNERGLYFGIEAKPIRKWIITAFYDVFSFPWLKSRADAPSHGNDLQTQLTYKPSKKLEMYFRYSQQTKQKNTPEDINEIDFLVTTNRQLLRYHIDYRISKTIRFRSRFELSTLQLSPNIFFKYLKNNFVLAVRTSFPSPSFCLFSPVNS